MPRAPGDTKEKINKCLNCSLPECTNCFGKGDFRRERGRPAAKWLVEGKMRGISEIAKLTGRSEVRLRQRIKEHGIEFAISKYSKYEDYESELFERPKNARARTRV